jgi:timeless
MIALFERELVLEILLVVGQEMELRENAQYNLLMMEILHHIVKTQDPTAVARSVPSTPSKSTVKPSASASNTKRYGGKSDGAGARSSKSLSLSFASSSALTSKLKQERSQLNNMKSVRHGHFSGTWMRRQTEGRRQFIGASNAVQGGLSQNRGLVQARRKNRLSEPFIGSSKSFLAHTRSQLQLTGSAGGPSAKRANQTLHEFCRRFLADCYGPFMKSIKNEFRRDSQRLEEKDKIVFFKLVWFFSQWSRISSSASRRIGKKDSEEAVGRLIITMDVFTFNLVLTATDSFYQQKKYTRLAQTVALYAEMMHLLHSMYTSKDKTEHEMAMGLIDRLFYHGQDALDQLPRLISRWTPGTYTREYLCDLIEVAHVSLKLLEANTKRGIEFVLNTDSTNNNFDNGKFSKKIAKMRKDAAEFDVKGYFVRKIVSNQFISMYSYLLDQYKVNAAVVNHRIIFMFLRVMRMEIATPDIADAEESVSPLEIRRVTLEPMLYNLQLLIVIERILNDDSIQKDKSFESLIKFSTSLLYKFWSSADSNPMLYVECLFQHATPHRFCESVTNMYVNDELRMMAEREMLQENQYRKRMEFGDDKEEIPSTGRDDEDEEAELEFTGDSFPKSSSSNKSNPNDASEATEETGNKCMELSEVQDDTVYPKRERSPVLSRKRSRESGDDTSDDDELFASKTQSQSRTKRRKNTIESEDSDDDAGIKEHLVGSERSRLACK